MMARNPVISRARRASDVIFGAIGVPIADFWMLTLLPFFWLRFPSKVRLTASSANFSQIAANTVRPPNRQIEIADMLRSLFFLSFSSRGSNCFDLSHLAGHRPSIGHFQGICRLTFLKQLRHRPKAFVHIPERVRSPRMRTTPSPAPPLRKPPPRITTPSPAPLPRKPPPRMYEPVGWSRWWCFPRSRWTEARSGMDKCLGDAIERASAEENSFMRIDLRCNWES